MYQLVLSTHSLYPWPMADIFALARDIGFDGLEVGVHRDPRSRDPEHLGRLRDFFHMPVYSVHAPFCPYVSGWEQEEVERVKKAELLAAALEARILVIHPALRTVRWFPPDLVGDVLRHFPWGNQARYHRWVEQFLGKRELAARVKIAVEIMPPERICGVSRDVYRFSDPFTVPPDVWVTMDVTHLGAGGRDIGSAYARLKEKVIHIHLSNFNGKEHRLLNDGFLPISDLLTTLCSNGYNGAVVLEPSPDAVQSFSRRSASRNLARDFAFCHALRGRGVA